MCPGAPDRPRRAALRRRRWGAVRCRGQGPSALSRTPRWVVDSCPDQHSPVDPEPAVGPAVLAEIAVNTIPPYRTQGGFKPRERRDYYPRPRRLQKRAGLGPRPAAGWDGEGCRPRPACEGPWLQQGRRAQHGSMVLCCKPMIATWHHINSATVLHCHASASPARSPAGPRGRRAY